MRLYRDTSLRAGVRRKLATLRRDERLCAWAADELRRCQPRSSAHVAGAVLLEARARGLRKRIRTFERYEKRVSGCAPARES